MVDVSRVRTSWTGFRGAPGVTTMYFLDTATCVESLHAFWTSMAGDLPGDVVIQVEDSGDIIDSETGDLTGSWVSDAVDPINGAGGNGYAAPVGACIDWLTSTIANHKRLRGRTFVVPLDAGGFSADGSPKDTLVTHFEAYGETLISEQSTSFVVWHRGTGTNGSVGLVTSAHVPDMAAVLRSRRD